MKNVLLLALILITSNCTINKIENNHGSAFLEIKEKKLLVNQANRKNLKNNVLVLEINNRGTLIDKKLYTLNDVEKIKFSDKSTLVSDKDTFINGFISSLRDKIDSPKRRRNKTNSQ